MKGCGCLFMLLTLGSLAASIFAISLALKAPSPLPPPPPISAEAAASFDQKLALLLASPAGTQIPITETELNSRLAKTMSAASAGPAGVQRLQIVLKDQGSVDAIALVALMDKPIWVTTRLGVSGDNGKLDIKIEALKLGALPIPTAMAGRILTPVKDLLGASSLQAAGLPDGIQSVKIQQGQLVAVAGRVAR